MKKDEELARLEKVLNRLITLENELDQIRQSIERIRQQGYVDATLHWRRENMLELVHSAKSIYAQKNNGRRREYIGTKQSNIDDAIARVERHKEYHRLVSDARDKLKKIRDIAHAIKNVYRVCGQQTQGIQCAESGDKPSMESGDNNSLPAAGICPHNEQEPNVSPLALSPSQVKEYFEQSPDLAGIAKDLPRDW